MSKLGAYNLSSGSGFQKSRAEAAFLNPKPSKKTLIKHLNSSNFMVLFLGFFQFLFGTLTS